jgi:hypothetical protein
MMSGTDRQLPTHARTPQGGAGVPHRRRAGGRVCNMVRGPGAVRTVIWVPREAARILPKLQPALGS